ncbi:MAG TPA: DUF6311 domain-containing protein, partial [Cyclobacteriaceae bacterium]
EPWGFPLGQFTNYFYPIGGNVGELLPILVKLMSPILPEKFQYIGIFLISSHVLVAYYALKIFRLFKIDGLIQLLATLLIVINPVLLYRFVHPSLTAHWLILGSIWLYFLSSIKTGHTRIMTYQFILFIVSGMIFPYLTVMTAGFLVTLAIKLYLIDHSISLKKFSTYLFTSFTILAICWYLIGLISFSNNVQMDVPDAYGLYGWNLSSFYNAYDVDINGYYKSNNLSALLPAYPLVSWHQYEGFSYLGLGVIFLFPIAVVLYFMKRKAFPSNEIFNGKKVIYPLLLFTLLATLFAISNVVTFNDVVLFRVPIPHFLQKIGDIFRASGRFIWISYYQIIIGILYFIATRIKSKATVAVLFSVSLCIQFVDLKTIILTDHFSYEEYHTPLHDEQWKSLINEFDKVMIYPPYITSNLTHDDYRYFTYFAAQLKKPINTGYLGRLDFASVGRITLEMHSNIKKNIFNDRWLYITTPNYASELLKAFYDQKVQILLLDGYLLFFSDSRKEELSNIVNQVRTEENIKALNDLFELQLPQLSKITATESSELQMNLYEVIRTEKLIYIKGWGFITGTEDLKTDSVQVLLKSGSKIWTAQAKRFSAPDVVDYFKNHNLEYAGFSAAIKTENNTDDFTTVGVSIFNRKSGTNFIKWSDATVGFEKFAETKKRETLPLSTESLKTGIDITANNEEELRLEGWGFLENKHLPSNKIQIVLSSRFSNYSFNVARKLRPDVASYFKDSTLSSTGFRVKIKKADLDKGVYTAGVIILDSLAKTEYFHTSDKIIKMGYPDIAVLKPLGEIPRGNEIIKSYIEKAEVEEDTVIINGWAYLDGITTDLSETTVILKDNKNAFYAADVNPVLRKDIQDHFKLSYNVDLAGFSVKLKKETLTKGKYEVCLSILNKTNGKTSLYCSGILIEI